MQNMLIIGMAGLYTSIVGLTLYLMFKLGDPAAMLGRLGALDGAAKQAAEAGMKVTIAAATTLAAGVLGSLLPLFSGKYTGLAQQMFGRNNPNGGPNTPGTTPGGGNDGGGPGAGGAAPQPRAPEDNGPLPGESPVGTTDNQLTDILNQGDFDLNGVNGAAIKKTLDDNGPDAKNVLMDLVDRNGVSRKVVADFSNGQLEAYIKDNGDGTTTRIPPGPVSSGSLDPAAEATEEAPTDATQPSAEDTSTSTTPVNSGALKVPAAPAAGGAAPSNTAPPQTNQTTTGTAPTSVAAVNEQVAGRIGESQKWVENYQQMVSVRRGKLMQELMAAEKAGDKDKIETVKEQIKALDSFDATKANMGDALSFLSKFDTEQVRMDEVRAGADIKPMWYSVMASGFIGGFKAVGGGAGSIPVIGNIIKGALNEYSEAPERAKAWQAAGGFVKHWKASTDAQRMKYYQQEVAPLAAGYQYQQMELVGGFQAMPETARFQVAQSVARMRSEYEALMGKALGEGRFNLDDLRAGNATVNINSLDLKGLGRVSAAANIGSVWGEAAAMQGDSWKVEVWDAAKQEFVKQNIKPNVMALSRIYSDLGVKQAGKYFDEAMNTWYGIVEKQYERGSADWNVTRSMSFDKAAAAKFINEDISTDYIVGGHLKMVQGKQSFFGLRGTYNAFLELRNQEEGQKYDKIVENPTAVLEYMQKNVASGKFSTADVQNAQIILNNVRLNGPAAIKDFSPKVYGTLTKAAGDVIGKENLRLTAIMEDAFNTSRVNILEKSLKAPSTIASENERLAEVIAKGVQARAEATLGNLPKTVLNAITLTDPKSGISIRTDSALKELGYFIQGKIKDTSTANQVLQSVFDGMQKDIKNGVLKEEDHAKLFDVLQENKNGILNVGLRMSNRMKEYLSRAANQVDKLAAQQLNDGLKDLKSKKNRDGEEVYEFKGQSYAYDGENKGKFEASSTTIHEYANLNEQALQRKLYADFQAKKRQEKVESAANDNDEFKEFVKAQKTKYGF
ncbi:MAG: hypothetical protein INF43_00770 [Alphaproteobacteria bacterium]|nr:hypothetical protein [Alphaproteobacteria bacterium]